MNVLVKGRKLSDMQKKVPTLINYKYIPKSQASHQMQ